VRDLREKLDGRNEGAVAPVSLVSLMLHIRDAAGMKSA